MWIASYLRIDFSGKGWPSRRPFPFSCVPQCTIDTRFAEPCLLDDRRHSLACFAQCPDLLHPLIGEFTLASELHPSVLGLGDAIHLALSPNVVLELSDQGKDAHDELAGTGRGVDRRIIQNLEADALLGDFRNNPVKVRGRPGQSVDLGDE